MQGVEAIGEREYFIITFLLARLFNVKNVFYHHFYHYFFLVHPFFGG